MKYVPKSILGFSASAGNSASRLLGFSASPGNSASRLLGFSASPGNSASRLLGFSASPGNSVSRLLGSPPPSAGPLYHRPAFLTQRFLPKLYGFLCIFSFVTEEIVSCHWISLRNPTIHQYVHRENAHCHRSDGCSVVSTFQDAASLLFRT